MLRLFAVAAVALMMAAIGFSVNEAKITGSRPLPHTVSTFFYGLTGR
jgi:hypothetical protein